MTSGTCGISGTFAGPICTSRIQFAALEHRHAVVAERRPRPRAAPVGLLALDGQRHFRAAAIARQRSKPRAKQLVQRIRKGDAVAARRRQNDFARLGVVERLHAGVGAHRDDGDFLAGRADPVELERIKAHALPADQRLNGHATCNKRQRGAVLGRQIGDMVGRGERAGARHVADDHRRIAGNEARQMPRHEAGVGVVEAARLMTGIDRQRLAGIEILRPRRSTAAR